MYGQQTISIFLLRLQYPSASIGIFSFISDPALACLRACVCADVRSKFVGLCLCVCISTCGSVNIFQTLQFS